MYKKIVLSLFVALLSLNTFAQLVYKTKFQAACERTGVVFRIQTKDIGSIPFKKAITKGEGTVYFQLRTFTDDNTQERVSDFSMTFGTGLLSTAIYLNCTEIESLIDAAGRIMNDGELRFISETANLCLAGSELEGYVDLLIPATNSSPGDFTFIRQGAVACDTLVKILADVKRASI